MSINNGLKYGLLAVLIAGTMISAFPVLAVVAIVFQFAIVLAVPLLAAAALAVPRMRRALSIPAESRPAPMPAAQRESPPALVSAASGRDARRLSPANGFAVAAVLACAVVAFPLLAALGLVFQFLAIFSLVVVLLSPFLARTCRTPDSSR